MYILVACETSGEVRRAFATRGHAVLSCDLLPADDDCTLHWVQHGRGSMAHYRMSVEEVLKTQPAGFFDMMLAFPPCTHLASSGARWFKAKRESGEQRQAIDFFQSLASLSSDIPKVVIENPVGIMSTVFAKPTQIIQPWMFGHGETKATCLWLWGLPPLEPTNIVAGREQRVWKMGPSPTRWKERSKTYSGIAQAMAAQWG